MNGWLSAFAWRRAGRLADRLRPLLRESSRVLDVGCGTGHNAEILRGRGLDVVETDVADLHVVGPGPVPCQDGRLPFTDDSFDTAMLLYVLQYTSDQAALLREVARVAPRIVILQSTYRGALGRAYLGVREYLFGRLAFRVARALRFVEAGPCPLDRPRLLTRLSLEAAIAAAGLRIAVKPRAPRLPVTRNLVLLERVG